MKTIEHGKLFGVCPHHGAGWHAALAGVLTCTGKAATDAEREAIVDSMRKNEAHWHSGILFTPGRRR